jgi:glucose/arabinose dehydrogenase
MTKIWLNRIAFAAGVALVGSCATVSDAPSQRHAAGTGPADQLRLPAPFETPSARNNSKVIGWPPGKTPKAAPGFEVGLFADKLDSPRETYVLPNKDVLVVESLREWPGRTDRPEKSANRITLFRDSDNDGRPDLRETFLTGLNMPEGMLLLGNWFYVGNTNGVVRYPYRAGQTKIDGKGEKILDLPAGGHHTRTLIADPTGKKIYVAIGSASNVDEENIWEKDQRRAGIVEINPDGSGARIFANGLRNPVGMDWEPKTKTLWTVVNERDLLGDDLVPDYLTSVKEGAFYGWPYSYFGQNEDPRKKASAPTSSPKRSSPTTPWAPTPHRSAWHSTTAKLFRNVITAAHSSACTAHGTARRWLAIKSPSCRSPTASPPARSKTYLPDSSPTKANSKPTAARSVSPSQVTARCSSPMTVAVKSGASRRKNKRDDIT